MNAATLLVQCLENEGVTLVFGLPGEENLSVLEAIQKSSIQFVTLRHEQAAAFMADLYGRLTGKTGVCLATLGPGATNLITGVADAQMDRVPLVAITGQASTLELHKESHQVLDLVSLFKPITKYSISIREPETIPEIIRKAFKVSLLEKPGANFIELPENIADMEVEKKPIKIQIPQISECSHEKIQTVVNLISKAEYPLILAGNGVIRAKATDALRRFVKKFHIPVVSTFMAKGVIPFSDPLCLGVAGLQMRDYIACAFDRADLVICMGYDLVEYAPCLWNTHKDCKIIHLDTMPAEVDEYYILTAGIVGDISTTLSKISGKASPYSGSWFTSIRQNLIREVEEGRDDNHFPLNPARILWDLKQVLKPDDIVVCDVGAHKIWTARLFQAQEPNTCIISNGLAAMGIALPGAIAAKMINPDKTIVALTGDGSFMMNSQEIETAMRLKLSLIILIWNDSTYGLIKWKQTHKFNHSSFVDFTNPDFVLYAQSFGAKAYRVESAGDIQLILRQAIKEQTVVVIDCPVNYEANLKLSQDLAQYRCPAI